MPQFNLQKTMLGSTLFFVESGLLIDGVTISKVAKPENCLSTACQLSLTPARKAQPTSTSSYNRGTGPTRKSRSGATVDLANGRKAGEAMGPFVVQGERFDLVSMEQALKLGLPERLSGSTPVTRLERSSSDSVILL